MIVINEKDLGKAIKEKKKIIEIRGVLKNRVYSIKSVEKSIQNECATQISMAVLFLQEMTNADGITTPVSVLTGTPILEKIASILGISNAFSSIMIAMAGGGVGILNQLRSYQIDQMTEEKIVLRR